MFPLMWLTTSKKIMSVKKPESDSTDLSVDGSPQNLDASLASKLVITKSHGPAGCDIEAPSPSPAETIDYSNGKIIASISYLVWAVVVVANVYVLVMLALGKGG